MVRLSSWDTLPALTVCTDTILSRKETKKGKRERILSDVKVRVLCETA